MLFWVAMSSFLISSPRLLLREFKREDAQDIYQLNEDPLVIQYTGDPPFASLDAALSFIEGYDAYAKHGMGRWAVVRREDSAWLGWCGLKWHPEEAFVDLGFRLYRKYWGYGYATEAAKASLEYGFKHLGLKRIVGRAMKENLASIRVLEKCGMSYNSDKPCGGELGIVMEIESPHQTKQA